MAFELWVPGKVTILQTTMRKLVSSTRHAFVLCAPEASQAALLLLLLLLLETTCSYIVRSSRWFTFPSDRAGVSVAHSAILYSSHGVEVLLHPAAAQAARLFMIT
jgi:hypothetical protein